MSEKPKCVLHNGGKQFGYSTWLELSHTEHTGKITITDSDKGYLSINLALGDAVKLHNALNDWIKQ